jgi:hypothetical protein
MINLQRGKWTTIVFLITLLFFSGIMPFVQAAPVWVVENAGASSNAGSSDTSLALFGYKPHISYYGNTDLFYTSKLEGGSWVSEMVEGKDAVGQYSSIEVDSAGKPHISFVKSSPTTNVSYASKTGSGWSIGIVALGGSLMYTSLELDSGDNPQIIYLNNTNSRLMYATQSTGGNWSSETVDTNVMGSNSLALNSLGTPHISYFDENNSALKYATKSTKGWNIETVDNSGNVGLHSSIALDSSGNPHISYYGEGCLKYASKSGGTWTIESADLPPAGKYVGWYTSLALDSHNNPHISYYDQSNNDLKYAAKSNGTWTKTTVDSVGNVGMFTSIAIDPHGYPHISYFDSTNHALKYASLVDPMFVVPESAFGSAAAIATVAIAVLSITAANRVRDRKKANIKT